MSSSSDDLRDRVQAVLPGVRRDLEDLVRIESVSADPERAGEVQRSAEAVRDLFAAEGFEAEILSEAGGAPAVVAHKRSTNADAPTVLLYAHHDVQPENDHAEWDSPPFEPTERAGARLYGRGAADDKAGIVAHLGAARVFGDDLPVHLNVFVEGEEEVGSDSLVPFLAAHKPAARGRRHRHRRLRQLGHRRARPSPRRCADSSASTSRSAPSPTPSTPACGAGSSPTR